MTLKTKTLLCVATAGLLFIPAILFNFKYLIIIGAFFDWLPLFTKWMRFGEKKINKLGLSTHVILTLTAYFFAVMWLIFSQRLLAFLFLEIWFAAVISGDFIYMDK